MSLCTAVYNATRLNVLIFFYFWHFICLVWWILGGPFEWTKTLLLIENMKIILFFGVFYKIICFCCFSRNYLLFMEYFLYFGVENDIQLGNLTNILINIWIFSIVFQRIINLNTSKTKILFEIVQQYSC